MGGAPSRVFGPTLIQGGEDVLESAGFFESNQLSHVVGVCHRTVSHEHVPSVKKDNVLWYDIPDMEDAAERLYAALPTTTAFIHEARTGGGHVYVHCSAGISRSSTVSIAYMMTWLQLDVDSCVRFLRAARPAICPNAGFKHKLHIWQRSPERQALRQRMLDAHPDKAGLLQHDMQHIYRIMNRQGQFQPLTVIDSTEVVDIPRLSPEECADDDEQQQSSSGSDFDLT